MRNYVHRSDRASLLICSLLTAIALFRIVSAYPSISIADDEQAHIACGMEWLDKGTFNLEPLHPPLARVAAAAGLFILGARLPQVNLAHDPGGDWFDIYPAGNEILYFQDRYARNLVVARLGELPFFLVGVTLVFLWTRSLYGPWGAVIGVLLYTTLPTVLAFAGLAYVDFALSVFLPVTLFAFVRWLELASMKRAATLGVAAGLATLSNLTALLFVPACMSAILVGWICKRNNVDSGRLFLWRSYLRTASVALFISAVVIWAGYRFSIKPLDQVFIKPAQDISQLAAPARFIARTIVRINPPVPAPAFFKGILASWMQNKKSPPSYALGRIQRGGFWYFYWLVLGLKTPLPFLILAVSGILLSLRFVSSWQTSAPALSTMAILLVSMVVKVDFGVRHILFIYPLLVVAAGAGADWLLQKRARWRLLASALLGALLVWQVTSSALAHPDYVAYFNVFGGQHPEEKLLFGCDLDCGQDVDQLARVVKARGITHLTLQLWTRADLSRSGFPSFDTLPLYQHANGWVAVSVLYLRSGHALWDASGSDGYAWLNSYQPVVRVGKTIRLYYVPDNDKPLPAETPTR